MVTVPPSHRGRRGWSRGGTRSPRAVTRDISTTISAESRSSSAIAPSTSSLPSRLGSKRTLPVLDRLLPRDLWLRLRHRRLCHRRQSHSAHRLSSPSTRAPSAAPSRRWQASHLWRASCRWQARRRRWQHRSIPLVISCLSPNRTCTSSRVATRPSRRGAGRSHRHT